MTGNHKKFEYFLFDWDLSDVTDISAGGMIEMPDVYVDDPPSENPMAPAPPPPNYWDDYDDDYNW